MTMYCLAFCRVPMNPYVKGRSLQLRMHYIEMDTPKHGVNAPTIHQFITLDCYIFNKPGSLDDKGDLVRIWIASSRTKQKQWLKQLCEFSTDSTHTQWLSVISYPFASAVPWKHPIQRKVVGIRKSVQVEKICQSRCWNMMQFSNSPHPVKSFNPGHYGNQPLN